MKIKKKQNHQLKGNQYDIKKRWRFMTEKSHFKKELPLSILRGFKYQQLLLLL